MKGSAIINSVTDIYWDTVFIRSSLISTYLVPIYIVQNMT